MGDLVVVMNEGRVEQVGTPDEIYRTPATRFVAGFVGSPPMNFFDGRLVRDEGARLALQHFSIPLPKDGVLQEGPVSLGIRPQHMRLAEPGRKTSLQMEVLGLERLGRESVLILEDEDGTRHRMLVEPSVSRRAGERVGVELLLDHGVFF